MSDEHVETVAQMPDSGNNKDSAQETRAVAEAGQTPMDGPREAPPGQRPPDSRWLAYVALLLAGLAILVSVYVMKQAQAYDERIMDTVDSLRRLDSKYGQKIVEMDDRLLGVESEQRLFLQSHYQAYLELIRVRLAVLAEVVKPADRKIIDDFVHTLKKLKIEGRYDKE